MKSLRNTTGLLVLTLMAAIFVAPGDAQADESCCLNNYRFAGGCMVVARGQETCQDIIAYLNNFNSVGKYYCDNTMVRGGWTLSDCGNPAMNTNPYVTPGNAQQAAPAQEIQSRPRVTEPPKAAPVQDATLIQTSAPLNVRFAAGIDSASQGAGQMVTGTLEEDLMSGDTLIAPAGSEVQFQLVPTSYWTDGGGDAFKIQATAIKVGDEFVPVNATAVAATGEFDTAGAEVSVPKGSLVSFETQIADQHAADKGALASGATAWMEAFGAKDIEKTAAFYAEDSVLLPPNAPAIFGRDAISATLQEMFAAGMSIELEDLEIKVVGNLGYKAGRYRTTAEDGSLIDRGKYIEIWSKIDGGWVIHRDIWNSSVQPGVEDQE